MCGAAGTKPHAQDPSFGHWARATLLALLLVLLLVPPTSRTEWGRVRGDAPSRLLSHQLLLFFFNPFCSQACSLPAKQLLFSSGQPPAPAPCLEPQGAGKEAARPPAAPAELPQERDHPDPPRARLQRPGAAPGGWGRRDPPGGP